MAEEGQQAVSAAHGPGREDEGQRGHAQAFEKGLLLDDVVEALEHGDDRERYLGPVAFEAGEGAREEIAKHELPSG